jgi:SAM-dependent methyltransferase
MKADAKKSNDRARSRLAAAIETAGIKKLSGAIIAEVIRGMGGGDGATLATWSSRLRGGVALHDIVGKLHAAAVMDEAFRGITGHNPDAAALANCSSSLREGTALHEIIRKLHATAVVDELYQGILKRAPDPKGGAHWTQALAQGRTIREAVNQLLDSEEFRGLRGRAIKQSELPDIRSELPRPYVTQTGLDGLVHHVLHIEQDSEFDLLERLIVEHRFYDSFGGWGYTIDLDKRVTAAMAEGLGARSCLDIGCSNGPVISLLAKDGVEVTGIDMSHLAFAVAYPAIRNRMVYGYLLAIHLGHTFDVVIAMDFFEHTNPLKLGNYIARAASLVSRDGYMIVNGPIFGEDRVVGQPYLLFLEGWTHEPQDTFWRNIPCYENGWPVDGHLVWASTGFWEQQFADKGLIRDLQIEEALQRTLSGFFAEYAPARKMLFILRSPDNQRCARNIAESASRAVLAVEGLPRPR